MTNTIIDLSDYGLLKIFGTDAKKMLQGQFTCDVEKVTPTMGVMGAHCNPQGRIISLFRLFQFEASYYLLMPRNMISIAHAALKKYAAFYKAELINASDCLKIKGYIGKTEDLVTTNQIVTIKIPSQTSRYIIIDLSRTVERQQPNELSISTMNTWKRLDISEGIPTIYPETTGRFLPHELNLDELHAISFEKGCYTGQEIIARMHYRGKLKNHLYQTHITSASTPLPGSDIYYQHGQETKMGGIIVDTCRVEYNNYHALIVAEEVNAKNNHLFLLHEQKNYFTIYK